MCSSGNYLNEGFPLLMFNVYLRDVIRHSTVDISVLSGRQLR